MNITIGILMDAFFIALLVWCSFTDLWTRTVPNTAIVLLIGLGLVHTVLIEWKYTESYGGTDLKFAKSGTDRTNIYRHLFDHPDCLIRKDLLPNFDALFFEPFYQFMRQQFLAHKMEKAHDMDADIVSLLHIASDHNLDFKKVTSPALKHLGISPRRDLR